MATGKSLNNSIEIEIPSEIPPNIIANCESISTFSASTLPVLTKLFDKEVTAEGNPDQPT